MADHYLDRLFAPRSVAVIGASDKPGSVGGRVLQNVLDGGFAGAVYPVNPKHARVAGRECYPGINALPEAAELALIATPAAGVPDLLRQCGERGVRAAVVYSAGFGETAGDDTGLSLRERALAEARRYRLRLLGPNCLGIIRPTAKLNATFTNGGAVPGGLALVSQSGALCTAILDWAAPHHIGFSLVASLGTAVDVDFGDVLDYLALDPQTHAIVLYIEGIRDARRFMSGLRSAARIKPVVVLKAGRHAEGARAARSHTGALVGADDVFDVALARAGAVRTATVEQLFAAAEILATSCCVRGNRLAIVTNAGGPGVLAADRAIDLGVVLATFREPTVARLEGALPAYWSHGNPVDVLGDAPPERFRSATAACLADADVDGVLVMLTPQAMTDPLGAARAVIDARGTSDKPVFACWMGETQVAAARQLFADRGVPEFPNPETAVEAFAYLTRYQHNHDLLLQVPGPLSAQHEPDLQGARRIVARALAERRELLTDAETRAVLNAFGIAVMRAQTARSPDEAVVAATSLGFPVAVKIDSPDITHKSDVNGVRLNVGSPEAVRQVYRDLMESVQKERPDARLTGVTVERMYVNREGRELHIGVVRDAVFGPVISFGLGGTSIEVLGDRAVALPPLNALIVDDLIGRTRAARLLGAFRHAQPADRAALAHTLLRVSEMACELPEIREMDINPLIADPDGTVALDARIIIDRPAPGVDHYRHMAIHPYPAYLVTRERLADGSEVIVRPIRPEDAQIEQTFVRNLSPSAKYLRFMHGVTELTPEMLVRFTQIDYDREMALIAVAAQQGQEVEIAVTRFVTDPNGDGCEFAIAVADDWRGKGLGRRLLSLLIEHARRRGLNYMEGHVLRENHAMLTLAHKLGFVAKPLPGAGDVYHVVKNLRP